MNLGDMILRVQRTMPQATGETIDTTKITFELNHGCDEINLLAKCFKGVLSYNLPAVTIPTEFSLYTIFPGYLGLDKVGVWFFDTNGKSHYLYPKTKRWLDQYIRNWRDNSGGSVPTWYYIRNDALGFYPFVNTNGNSITIDALIKSTPMTNNSNYPWLNQATELTTLRCFDNAIIAYATWRLAPAIFDKEGRNYYEEQFNKEVKKSIMQVHDRPDMTSDYDYYMRADISTGFLPR